MCKNNYNALNLKILGILNKGIKYVFLKNLVLVAVSLKLHALFEKRYIQ